MPSFTTRIVVVAALTLTIVLALGACSAPSVTSVSIDGGDRTVVIDDALTLTVTVVTGGGASDAVTWQSSDATVAAIDGAGNVSISAVGTTEVTATSTVDPSRSDTVTLTVDPLGVLEWTRQFGTTSNEFAFAVATDASGNVYSVGRTGGALEGPAGIGWDVFVRSYDSAGDLRWTRQFGADISVYVDGVATDANGNVYVAGHTTGDLEGVGHGGFDVFVRSYDGAGSLRWTRQFGTSDDDRASGVATDASGNVYVAGRTTGDLAGESAGGADAFVRSFDSAGTLRWTRQFGSSSDDGATGVATDASGNVYVSGNTFGALDGPFAGLTDVFVRSYDGEGALRWTRQFGTTSTDQSFGVATDGNGNVYVTGRTLGALEGDSAGFSDAFVRSFGSDGTVRWTRQFGTSTDDEARSVAADASGNVYVAGATLGALEGDSTGGSDAFVRSYGNDGALRWTRQFGTSFNDIAFGVATDANGGVYLTGQTFGALEGASAGGFDAFVRKYGR